MTRSELVARVREIENAPPVEGHELRRYYDRLAAEDAVRQHDWQEWIRPFEAHVVEAYKRLVGGTP